MAKSSKFVLVPMMLSFFCMGFVDLVGTASNYVKAEQGLTDSVANVLPSLVFFWFLIFSVPTSVLMNKIGKKNTVLLSLAVTALSLLLPVFGNSFPLMLVAFSLLGIGNTLMQTSLNPLMALVSGGENLASQLTFGQFIKAIASFMAPLIAGWGYKALIPTFGLDWRVLFAIYFVVSVLATVLLWTTPVNEELRKKNEEFATAVGGQNPSAEANSSFFTLHSSFLQEFANCFRLLGVPVVLLSFLGIMCHVGIDVGTNTTAPKLLQERVGMSLDEAGFATSLYFIFRTMGCLTGSYFLRVLKTRTFFIISVCMMAASMLLMGVAETMLLLYIGIALVGYGNSNVFSMCFAQALTAMPEKQNEVSGLMIMGLFGGTIFPLIMGFASDAMGQVGAVIVMAIGVAYLFTYIKQLGRPTPNPSL